jgi:plastocyanin
MGAAGHHRKHHSHKEEKMSRRLILFLTAVAVMAVLLSACGGGAGGGGGTPLTVSINATEFKFDPGTINATPGQTINLTVKNNGSVQHTWALATANVKLTIDPGKTATATFNAPTTAGTYQFECDLPGHKEAGMIGQLVVK